jgi:Uma2 family endonuclease
MMAGVDSVSGEIVAGAGMVHRRATLEYTSFRGRSTREARPGRRRWCSIVVFDGLIEGALAVSTFIATPPPIGSEGPWPLYRISLDQYEAMVESGIFTERDRLQLINGMLVAKVTQGDDHCVADDLCRVELSAVLPPGWFVRPGKPVRMPPDGMPEPDEAVMRGSARDYARRKRGTPGAQDVGLIVEVAYTSLAEDRAMVAVYGRNGIPVYWILNLVDRQVEVYSCPQADGYATRTDYQSGQHVPVVLDGAVIGQIAVDDLLP